jgi:N-methylhydantoinase B/oxoprolinase/acetone carboxylase alpha subunit
MFRLETPGGGGYGQIKNKASGLLESDKIGQSSGCDSMKSFKFKTGSLGQFSAIQESA